MSHLYLSKSVIELLEKAVLLTPAPLKRESHWDHWALTSFEFRETCCLMWVHLRSLFCFCTPMPALGIDYFLMDFYNLLYGTFSPNECFDYVVAELMEPTNLHVLDDRRTIDAIAVFIQFAKKQAAQLARGKGVPWAHISIMLQEEHLLREETDAPLAEFMRLDIGSLHETAGEGALETEVLTKG